MACGIVSLPLLTWKKNMERIPTAANMQNDLRAGRIVEAPMPKAMKSVMEVMVMATPAWAMVVPSLSSTDMAFTESGRVFRH